MKLKKRQDDWRAEVSLRLGSQQIFSPSLVNLAQQALRVSQNGHNPEFGEVNSSLVRVDRNMDKRLPGNSSAPHDSSNTGI